MLTLIGMCLEAWTKFTAGELYFGLLFIDFTSLMVLGSYIGSQC